MTDAVIIGGGLLGLGAAVELTERGADVLVLEKDGLGFEQTVRSNAALRLPDGGTEQTGTVAGVSMVAWDGFEDRYGDVELDRAGWNTLVVDEEDAGWLRRAAVTVGVSEHVDPDRLTPPDEVRARWPALAGPFLGMHTAPGGHVNRMRVVAALHRAARRGGARFRLGATAVGFDRLGDRIRAVRTTTDRVPCGAVLVAAGVWTPRLLDELGAHVPMQRVRVPSGETAPLGEDLVPGFVRAGKFTARQNADGVVRFGGGYRAPEYVHDVSVDDLRDLGTWAPAFAAHLRGATVRVDPHLVRHELARLLAPASRRDRHFVPTEWEPRPWKRYSRQKLARAARVIPALEGVRIQRFSSGVVDMTPDFEPLIGRVPGTGNAWVAGGMSGHGFILGPGAWRAVAEEMTAGRTAIDLGPYRPDRFAPRRPGRGKRRAA
jgi:glycine/D-amino acid oxidase-like deaminating enzyme